MVDPGLLLGGQGLERERNPVLKFGREPSLIALCLCFWTLHTNEISRTDPLVQVDYVRVVDLDTGASNSDKVVTEVTPAGDFWKRSLNIRIISLPKFESSYA